ncbi:uncharacterized protein J4E88_010422 [Alternaria novae-zelandiae]|uniref:uncharacterized protein n=1 Tax=Alternaria novae-zelandiae TaxID=430562 RepID=UPI0020C36771|nr:uncharacterized protein J4E88_010422 [Alternaria novae-zelandiae]KAI4666854.1 hypothetical protein J4E88_010422 [Alternaria novae-zelandiae]
MPSMASSIHPDFRDDVTSAEAHAVDRETERLIHQQLAADNASGRQRYIQLAKEMLRIRLRAYKPESPPVAGAWCLIGSAHLKASQLQEAKEATEKSLEIYAAGNDAEKENSAALAREQLGLIFEGLGQMPDAKRIRLQGASDGTMAKTRQPLSFDGRWMTMARSKAGEVISVTYYTRTYANKQLPSPLPSYRNAEGRTRSMNDIDFDTVSSEIVERCDRNGLTVLSLTAAALKVWEKHGLELLSRDDVKKLEDDEAPTASKTNGSERAVRKRNRNSVKTAELPAAKKRQSLTVASAATQTEDGPVLFVSQGTQTDSPVADQQIADLSEREREYDEDDSAWETQRSDNDDDDVSTVVGVIEEIGDEADWESDGDTDGEAEQEADGDDGLVTVKLPSGRERRVSKLNALLLAWVNT